MNEFHNKTKEELKKLLDTLSSYKQGCDDSFKIIKETHERTSDFYEQKVSLCKKELDKLLSENTNLSSKSLMNECCKKTYKSAIEETLFTLEKSPIESLKHHISVLKYTLKYFNMDEKEEVHRKLTIKDGLVTELR